MVYEAEICITSNLRRSLVESLNCDRLEGSAKTELRKLLLDDYTESSNKSTVVPIRLVKAVHKAINQGEYIPYSDFGRLCLAHWFQSGGRMDPIYLHEMLKGCELHLPEYTAPPRNPELEARIQYLKAEAAEREYKKMTKNVSNPETFYKENIGHEIKSMNNQIIAVVNFAVTVGGAFVFGYKASEAAMEIPNVAIQLTVAMILATIVFFADLYFLIKKTM